MLGVAVALCIVLVVLAAAIIAMLRP